MDEHRLDEVVVLVGVGHMVVEGPVVWTMDGCVVHHQCWTRVVLEYCCCGIVVPLILSWVGIVVSLYILPVDGLVFLGDHSKSLDDLKTNPSPPASLFSTSLFSEKYHFKIREFLADIHHDLLFDY